MHFDDRLATVLRLRADGERAARTQFRQLIDLLGERPQAGDRALKAAAYLRLIALGELIEPRQRAAIVGEHGWRFRNPELVKWFGEAHPHVAAAALYRAQLTGPEWAALIPKLPIRARGFLRHRRDLPAEAIAVLDQLGVSDRALPEPEILELMEELDQADMPVETSEEHGPTEQADKPQPQLQSAAARVSPGKDDIRTLVERIEGFRRARSAGGAAGENASPATPPTGPEVVSDDADVAQLAKHVDHFLFSTDHDGRIQWAPDDIAPMVVGADLKSAGDAELVSALKHRQPVREAAIRLRGARAIAGSWIVDAFPRFTAGTGRFIGHAGQCRRVRNDAGDARIAHADRLRQLLHELRTPVNAMQGYAEIIQQQMIGPVPHEYRAIAATIAGDSARILAGFDELDRLAKLEAGVMDLDEGTSDFAAIVRRQVAQLQTVLGPRVARFDADLGEAAAQVAIDTREAEGLAWRVLATLAGTTGAGEALEMSLASDASVLTLTASLPGPLQEADDIFSVETRPAAGSLSAGIFGAGFSLRLARAEAQAAGGTLMRSGDTMELTLPLVGADSAPSDTRQATG